MSLNHELSDLFKTFAAVMEIKGESVFKSIAFSKVSRLLKDMTIDIKKTYDEGKLGEIEGIGASSKKIIEDYIKTGRSTDYDSVVSSVPPGLIPLLEIPSLGPKTIAMLWKERGVESLEDLKKAIDAGKLDGLKGMGEKKIESIKQGIELRAAAGQRMGIGEALPIAQGLVESVRKLAGVKQAEIAGSLRRRRETIGDVDIVAGVAASVSTASIAAAFTKFPEVSKILGQGPTKASILTPSGLQVDLRIVPIENFGAALLYFTGSKDHNVKLRGRAQDQKTTLNEWGLYKLSDYEKAEKKTGEAPDLKPLASKTEADVYKKLGLPFIEPELREDRGEIVAADENRLPNLITRSDIRGDLHTHTTASDGINTIEEMAAAAKALGYEYLAVTDHSKSQVIANGLTAERLMKHAGAIRKIGDKLKGIKLLVGCEVDILADGHLDFEDAVLEELDIVIASPHVALKQDQEKSTARILKAIDNKYVNVIGHPTGRLINSRVGLPLDFERIFTAAKASGTALEINSGYPRLDLDEIHARAAVNAGVMLSINTDAHSADGLDWIHFGIGVARRAWATADNVINCLTLAKLKAFIDRKRK